MALPTPIFRLVIAASIIFVLYFLILRDETPVVKHDLKGYTSHTEKGSKIIVVARKAEEDVSWIAQDLPDWQSTIYTTNTHTSGSGKIPPSQNGNPATSYLTYIIEHYTNLPETIVFTTGARTAWHNDEKIRSLPNLLQSLQISYVQKEGYANLRCQWNPGCPAEEWGLTLSPSIAKGKKTTGVNEAARVLARDWQAMFGESENMPGQVAQTCCGQFVVSKENVERRARKDYVRLRHWAMNADVEDDVKAAVFEHLWQVVFGWDAVTCPKPKDCYCKLYGKCNKGLF